LGQTANQTLSFRASGSVFVWVALMYGGHLTSPLWKRKLPTTDFLAALFRTQSQLYNPCFTLREETLDTKRMLEEVETEITKLQRVADVLRGSESRRSKPRSNRGRGHGMSAAARRKISLAQKARWAKQKASGPSHGPKRTISAASRRRMAAAQRRRWSKVKAKA
jgi:hypothetical protein